MNTRHLSLLAVALLLAASGCGDSELCKVSGRLSYKGQPVPSTMLTFVSEQEGQRPSRAVTDMDGSFSLAFSRTQMGVLRGKYSVALTYYVSAEEETGAIKPLASRDLKKVISKYGDHTKSPLKYEINGTQFIDMAIPE